MRVGLCVKTMNGDPRVSVPMIIPVDLTGQANISASDTCVDVEIKLEHHCPLGENCGHTTANNLMMVPWSSLVWADGEPIEYDEQESIWKWLKLSTADRNRAVYE